MKEALTGMTRAVRTAVLAAAGILCFQPAASSEEPAEPHLVPRGLEQEAGHAPRTAPPTGTSADWHYGAFVDTAYALDFNFPANHLFRNRTTTPRVNELDLNMAAAYIRKDAVPQSRWGTELTVQGGQDAKDFGFDVNKPKVEGSDALRHFGRANVSYLAPVGNGLMLQAGLFNSLIGYDSLYAKDNFAYTRPWGGDYTPYLMFGANASYSFNERWTGTFFIINEYFHLQNTNSLPSYGGQVLYKPSSEWSFKETIYYGPDQANTSMEFWRLFSDSIAEWKGEILTLAFEYQAGTEVLAVPGSPRVFWMAAQLPIHWQLGLWGFTLRPEVYWDRNGNMTGFEQLIRAVTTTLEYRIPYKWTNTIMELEYRYDESTGPGGGFFKGNEIRPGVVG
ncbi:MAG TPA: outer membrane beta-barrel protein [Nitrospiraceae bacterium]|nr:outer membrane beta-barrel protein [Nitrospiraceae bacterium]